MSLSNISQNKVADGWHKQYTHDSATLNCTMRFAIFLPPNASKDSPVPVLYWLSGLTCSDENFMQKAGAFKKAAELGMAIVAPDTSPRGDDVADDEGYDLGKGAGSTSMRPRSRGLRTTVCTTISFKSYLASLKLTSQSQLSRPSLVTAWAGMVR